MLNSVFQRKCHKCDDGTASAFSSSGIYNDDGTLVIFPTLAFPFPSSLCSHLLFGLRFPLFILFSTKKSSIRRGRWVLLLDEAGDGVLDLLIREALKGLGLFDAEFCSAKVRNDMTVAELM